MKNQSMSRTWKKKKNMEEFLLGEPLVPVGVETGGGGGVKREREEAAGLAQPEQPQEKRLAPEPLANPLSDDLAAPAYHDFGFHPNLDLEGRPMEQASVMEQAVVQHQHYALPPSSLAMSSGPADELVSQAAASRDPVLDWEATVELLDDEEKASRLVSIRSAIDRRKAEIMMGYDREKERLSKQKARVVSQLESLRRQVAECNPEAEWRAAMRDPVTGVQLLSKDQCSEIIARLMTAEECKLYFCQAVDPVALGIQAYFDIVERPMDLGKIQNQLMAGQYDKNTDLFIADVRLVFRNCECFNAPHHEATQFAVRASEMFEKAIRDPKNFQTHIKTKSKAKKSVPSGSSLSASGSKISSRPAPRKYTEDDDGDDEPHLRSGSKSGGGGGEFSDLQLTHVRMFCEDVTRHPGCLKKKKLAFFKDFLDRWYGNVDE